MSCNPSIGGIGKGHLVREVDAMGGVMGACIDEAAIHYRVLNRSKGPAVWGPRAQADRELYKAAIQRMLAQNLYADGRLEVVEGSAEDVVFDDAQRVIAVRATLNGVSRDVSCGACVITTGTFLRGRCYIGHDSYAAGRHVRESENNDVEPPSVGLALTLEETLKLPLSRLKTGTPPRLDGKTIDWARCIPQPSEPPFRFSYLGSEAPEELTSFKDSPSEKQLISCYRTATNEGTHDLVRKYAHTLAPPSMTGNGPRYCPSLYKKVERFGERSSHVVWLEPEGLTTDLVYPNGLSGAFPQYVQQEIINSIVGMEGAKIVVPGYDVEYDFVDPRALDHTLAVKTAPGLYCAGQIIGTTGYEEAAALGVIAGANAALHLLKGERFVVGRDEGYIGVLVDDLVTQGTLEPYRMFTSRAEYRLSLRADNADLRLTHKAAAVGLVGARRDAICTLREAKVDAALREATGVRLSATDWYCELDFPPQKRAEDGRKKTAVEVLSMPHATLETVEAAASRLGHVFVVEPDARDTVEALAKYGAYLERQDRDMEAYRKSGDVRIPPDLDYRAIASLSNEEKEKLERLRPNTFADAAKISGVTPTSLVYLYQLISTTQYKRLPRPAPAAEARM
ncbi:glucose inhibited division protein A-domain-containing protein [Pelagophyceae sp. CCMP2097]|nr:glucose inhibited division protein A-domain-containing protein [Pelagophyceae sp. CCMP2097]